MKRIVFYSWQSDLPNSLNRGLIEDVLIKASEAIHKDGSIEVEPVVDRDIKGIGGSPDISKAIFEKIDNSSVFVADVTIINKGEIGRKTPNPNVLIELGYAMKALGSNRVLLIMNKEFGGPELLPFDLKTRHTIVYQVSSTRDKSSEKKYYKKKLKNN